MVVREEGIWIFFHKSHGSPRATREGETIVKPQRRKGVKTNSGVKPARNRPTTQPRPNRLPSEDLVAELRELLEPVVKQADLYLEKIQVKRAGAKLRVEVYVDLPAGTESVGSKQLEEVSRQISATLDGAEPDPLPGAYDLEVSSLGAEHELTSFRLFERAVGKDVELRVGATQGEPVGPRTLIGKLEDVDPEELRLAVPGVKGRPGQTEIIAMKALESARTVVIF